MRRPVALFLLCLGLATGARTTPAHALADPGTAAPDFTKNQLVSGAIGPAWSLSAQAGKVVVLFVLGYS